MFRVIFVVTILVAIGVCASGQYAHKLMVKDGRLEGLVDLLNSRESRILFQNWKGNLNDSTAFLKILEPWILHDSAVQLISRSPVEEAPLDCANPLYSSALSGATLEKQRLIVDFVPFGYDVEKLLVRFYETAAYVDVFVIYEMPYTLLGNPKPLFFNRIRDQPRFRSFLNKVIYVNSDMAEMQLALDETRQAISRFYSRTKMDFNSVDNGVKMGSFGQSGKSEHLEPAMYAVMRFFNKDLMVQFKRIGTFAPSNDVERHNERLKGTLMAHIKSGGQVFAIQNDGDEFVNGKVLRHLRSCALHSEVKSVFTPCFGFKNNYNWLQTTFDMRHFTSGQKSTRDIVDVYKYLQTAVFGRFVGKSLQMELNQFIWRLGPFLWPLQTVMDADSMLRRNFTQDRFFSHHMGYGAATHMSAVNEPVELWYKACGTVEMVGTCERSVPLRLRQAAAIGNVTAKLVYDSTVFPWCHRWNKVVHVSTLSKRARRVVLDSIPWVVRNNPTAFPFMVPSPGLRTTGLFERVADPLWALECESLHAGLIDT